MSKPRVIFMGTPKFACGMLDALMQLDVEVVAVVSQPDKPVGRKREILPTPVKVSAMGYNLSVIQPISIKEDYQLILDYAPDLIVTCAYGQIVPSIILNAPQYGCLNIHASLLPLYRGGAPIHMAIIRGEKETGITLMRMIEKMDAGAIVAQKKVTIEEKDTTEILYDKLEIIGKELLMESLIPFLDGKLKERAQEEDKVTYAWNITKEQEFVSFDRPVRQVYNHLRGLISWPVGYGIIAGKKVKFHQVQLLEKKHNEPFGKLVKLEEDGLLIAAQDGFILATEIQLEGKSKVSAKEFYNGVGKQWVGECFQ